MWRLEYSELVLIKVFGDDFASLVRIIRAVNKRGDGWRSDLAGSAIRIYDRQALIGVIGGGSVAVDIRLTGR